MATRFEVHPGEEARLARHGLVALDDFFRLSSGRRLDKAGLESWRQRWRLDLPEEGGRLTCYLKRFLRPPLRRQWERWREGHWSLGTAGVEWRNAQLLAAAGIAAVSPVAFGQEMFGPWERRSFVLSREVPGESLERWLPAHVPPAERDPDPARRRGRLNALADFIGRFHRAGFVHRDLYLSHVFMADEAFRLIDLQRVFRPKWRWRRWVVKDLAALHFSTPADRVGRLERLRFLVRYVRTCGRCGPARPLARLIENKARRMARRRPEHAAGVPQP